MKRLGSPGPRQMMVAARSDILAVTGARRLLRKRLYALLAVILVGMAVIGFVRAYLLVEGRGLGLDFTVYWDATNRWLAGESFYFDWQAQPYHIHGEGERLAVLMPPSFIPVALPFAFLPREVAGALWVIVPVIVIAWAVYRMRPAPWSWPILGLLVAWPWTGLSIFTGNPTMALTAVLGVGLATGHKWLAAAILVKPTLAPFAALGVRDRRWWAFVALGLLVSVPFGVLWFEWIRAVMNAQDGGLLYALPNFPIMALPVVAWIAGYRPPSRRTHPSIPAPAGARYRTCPDWWQRRPLRSSEPGA